MLTQFENLVYSKSKANCVCFSPDSKFAITGNSDNTVRVWDLRNEENIQTLEGHLSPINSVCISIDGRRIVSGSGNSWMPMGRSDNTIKVWNFEPNRDIEKRNNPKSVVNCVCVTYDRKWAVSGNMDKTLRVWDIETGENLKIIEGHKDRVNSVCLMLGGRRLVSGSSDMTLKVWDIQTGENLKTLEGHKDAVLCACITPDSKLIISGSIDQTICIWDFETGKCFKILKGHTSSINCICLSPDGRMLISGSGDILSGSANIFMSAKATNSDNTIRIWDVETGENLSTLTGHTSLIKSVCVTPDNKFIVSGSADGTVRVWDIKSKNNILILSGHINHVSSVIVTPDGKEIISGSCGPGSFHTVRVWDIETGENISTFHSKSDVYAISRISMDRLFIVGTGEGITCIRMINFSRDMALTPQRLWHFGNNGLSGKWSDNITAFCEYCGSYFKLPRMILNNIKYFNKNNFLTSGNEPCYQSMKENLDESDYISVCPKCNNKLKFNPFMVHDPEEAERNRIVLENQRYSKVLETAENAFNESDWDNAFNLFLSLIQAERFDINYLRFKMALCRINSLDVYKPEIIANIEVLKRLLSESGESEKVQRINDNLIDRIEAIKKAKKTWWKIF
jgi:WD40 repeat protein